MTPDPQKKPTEGAPVPGTPSDSDATMKAAPNGSDFDPRRLSIEDLDDPKQVAEALTHWDELEPALLTAIETHPQHGPRLAMLRRADHWLETKGAGLRAPMPCPSAEELYDFGRGPGFGPIVSARRAELERHLRTCAECEKLVETLAAPPPVPLELPARGPLRMPARAASEHAGANSRDGTQGPPASIPDALPTDFGEAQPFARADHSQPFAGTASKRRLRALPRLAPIAVAASLIIGLGLWIAFSPSDTDAVGFPHAPLLRGSAGGPLFFPRDRVLHVTPAVRAAFPALDGRVVFEIEPQAEATNYRVDLARHAGDAFAADEASLMKLSGAASTIPATAEITPGQYTWTARAVVRGLDQDLGQRDFALVDDADVSGQLAALASRAEPGRSLTAIKLLHERGYFGEARAIARAMPASPERDAYLSQVPGR
jgi:hypothetical protein